MDEKVKENVLKNVARILSATTSGDIRKIEAETILIIKESTDSQEEKK